MFEASSRRLRVEKSCAGFHTRCFLRRTSWLQTTMSFCLRALKFALFDFRFVDFHSALPTSGQFVCYIFCTLDEPSRFFVHIKSDPYFFPIPLTSNPSVTSCRGALCRRCDLNCLALQRSFLRHSDAREIRSAIIMNEQEACRRFRSGEEFRSPRMW